MKIVKDEVKTIRVVVVRMTMRELAKQLGYPDLVFRHMYHYDVDTIELVLQQPDEENDSGKGAVSNNTINN